MWIEGSTPQTVLLTTRFHASCVGLRAAFLKRTNGNILNIGRRDWPKHVRFSVSIVLLIFEPLKNAIYCFCFWRLAIEAFKRCIWKNITNIVFKIPDDISQGMIRDMTAVVLGGFLKAHAWNIWSKSSEIICFYLLSQDVLNIWLNIPDFVAESM